MKSIRLNGNALKVVAMVSMFVDHLGMLFFPSVDALRVVGRLSFPIYAYLISEGCRYTRDRKRYFLQVALLGVLCSAVYVVAERELYLCVLVTFSLSILLVYLVDYVRESFGRRVVLLLLAIAAVGFLCRHVEVDYGFFGVLVPVMVYIADGKRFKLAMFTVSLAALSASYFDTNPLQVYGLASVVLVALYDGTRGRLDLKWFFYLFYPVHLAVLWLVYTLVR